MNPEVLRRAVTSLLGDVRTALPGQVQSYDAEKQVAEVQLMVKRVLRGHDGDELVESFPLLPSVPVRFPRGGGYFLTFPLQKGDFVLVTFCDTSVKRFHVTGKESHPVDLERHGFSGAVAHAGFFPETQALGESGVDSGLLLGKEGGPHLYIESGKIELGKKGASDKASLDSKIQTELSRLKSELDNFKTVFDAHTHNFSGATASSCTAGGAVGTCTGSTVTSSTPFPPPASPGETASQLVKIDS